MNPDKHAVPRRVLDAYRWLAGFLAAGRRNAAAPENAILRTAAGDATLRAVARRVREHPLREVSDDDLHRYEGIGVRMPEVHVAHDYEPPRAPASEEGSE